MAGKGHGRPQATQNATTGTTETMILDRGMSGKRVIGVVPARLASTRLPRKVLRQIAGRPLLQWVVEAARQCPELDEIVVATDAEEVGALCERQGWTWRMTSAELASGTDRLCAVAQELPADIYVNIQGDEPLLEPEHVRALLDPFAQPEVEVTTLKLRCPADDVTNPNAVKVVTAADGRALYFSRATIPFDRDGTGATYWKHMGLYAFRRAALLRFPALPASGLEQTERLEQLRLLEAGVAVFVAETTIPTVGVDTEDDLLRVEGILRKRHGTG